MTVEPLVRAGQAAFAAGCTLGAYVTAEWVGASGVAAAAVALVILGIVLALLGMDADADADGGTDAAGGADGYEWEDDP